MPIYDYQCAAGHREERLRKYYEIDDPTMCKQCLAPMIRVPSVPHCMPDGMYSYSPNLGDPEKFERRMEAQRHKKRVIEAD